MAKNEKSKKDTSAKTAKANKKPGKIARWFKDFRGEIKKIFWPDAKTVAKNTLIVLIVVTIAALVIWAFDLAMSSSLDAVKKAAGKDKESTTAAAQQGTANAGVLSQSALEEIAIISPATAA